MEGKLQKQWKRFEKRLESDFYPKKSQLQKSKERPPIRIPKLACVELQIPTSKVLRQFNSVEPKLKVLRYSPQSPALLS